MTSASRINENRIDTIAVIAGVMLTLASMFMVMSLAAALGIWSYRPDELPFLGPQFWTVVSIAWIFASFVGSVWAAMAARSIDVKTGLFNGITSWAGAYLLYGGIALTIADSNLRTLIESPTVGLFWHGFVADMGSFLMAILGGYLGTCFERGFFRIHSLDHFVMKKAEGLTES